MITAPNAAQDGSVPHRPRLLPEQRWAKVALLLICCFAFVKGGLWAATTPSFWGPDEDYHFMYVDHVATTGTIIDPDKPLYSPEYVYTVNLTQFNAYGVGPRLDFSGDPKAVLRKLAHLPSDSRDQLFVGRDPAVVHPPLFYYLAAVPDKLSERLGGNALPTRMLWVRLFSAAVGAVAVFAAWLLASQVFVGRPRRQLLVALLVATQPILGFLSGFVSNDIAVIAMFTSVTAFCAFLLRVPPAPRQGLWLGGLLTLAVLTKSTALVLLPVCALTLLLQQLTFRDSWRTTLHLAALVAAPLLVGGLWWYVHSEIAYGTITGEVLVNGIASSSAHTGPAGAGHNLSAYLTSARLWLADAYRTAWFHPINYEAPRGRWVYFAPGTVLALGGFGLVGFVADRRRDLLNKADARVRQASVLTASCAVLVAPFLYLDLGRAANGQGFLVNAGRFVMPAYAAMAALGVLGLGWLVSDRARTAVFGTLAAGSTAMCWYVWRVHFVKRYYGAGSLADLFHRMSFDRPGWIEPATYWVTLAVLGAMLVGFFTALLLRGAPLKRRKFVGAAVNEPA